MPHPLAFAGWLGLMITALNLLPVGQLDGGHISHALFGRNRAQGIGSATLVALAALGLFVWSGLLFWALVVFFTAGSPGMPPMEDVTLLDGRRASGGLGLVRPSGADSAPAPARDIAGNRPALPACVMRVAIGQSAVLFDLHTERFNFNKEERP